MHGIRLLCFALVIAVVGAPPSGASRLDVVPGQAFPDLEFASLLSPEDYSRLGLKQKTGAFRLSDVPGEFLVIEFFNKSCVPCQRQVREVEHLYKRTLSPGSRLTLRVLGVAVGNQPEYLHRYREKRGLNYPITADPEFAQWERLGEPGRTPFIVYLRRVGPEWILHSFHFGVHLEEELLEHGMLLVEGRALENQPGNPNGGPDQQLEMPLDDEQLQRRAAALLSRLAGFEMGVERLPDKGAGHLFRSRRAVRGVHWYVRAATRAPVCEVCHAVHFLYAFDAGGQLLGFEPIHVTKYGNAVWSEDDVRYFDERIRGRMMRDLPFDPQVDAVSSATMSSALIFHEIRKAAQRVLPPLEP